MHWADVLADELLEAADEHVLATGITPSGPIHVGNLREVLTTEAVHRAVQDAGGSSTLLYVGDTYDPLREVYPFLEDHPEVDYEEHVGRPISEVPVPHGDADSYAEAFLDPFLAALDELGVEPEVHLAHELYESGAYAEAIHAALEHRDALRRTLNEVAGRDLAKGWVPFNVRCPACGRISTTEAEAWDGEHVAFSCTCGHEGEVDPLESGTGKLPWRVDWPARWSMLDVTFEAFGKDHAADGGSWATAVPILEEAYDREPPHHAVYEWFTVRGEGAMSSSAGTGIAAEDVLEVTPPEALRFLFLRYQPDTHVEFDAREGLLDLVDEYDRTLEAVLEDGEDPEVPDAGRVLELAQPRGPVPDHAGAIVPMRHLATLVQIYEDTDAVLGSVRRSGHVDDLDDRDERLLSARAARTRAWTRSFAPEHLRFEVPDQVPHGQLQDVHRKRLDALLDRLEAADWTPDELQNAVYEAADDLDTGAGGVFKAAYLALLGQSGGPRLGPFLAGLEREPALDRLREAAAGPGA
jgi:lysyl-tRNA synthetase class 1